MTIRLALTLPGGVALGAFEAGALAALVVAVGDLCEGDEPPVCVDLIGASSAGSLTSVLVVRALLEGLDPVDLLRRAWVEQASLPALLHAASGRAPLSGESLERLADTFLHTPGRPTGHRQSVPVVVSVALTNLRGLAHRVPAGGEPIVTYLDWGEFSAEPAPEGVRFTTPPGVSLLELVLASAANPVGFRPRLVSRAAEESSYRAAGVQNFPATGSFWYADGSLLKRKPLGRSMRLARARRDTGSAADRRVHVVLEPLPIAISGGRSWADPAAPPSWLAALRRSAQIMDAQSIFDDVRESQEVNERCRAIEVLGRHLTGCLDDRGREAVRQALAELGGGVGDPADDTLIFEALARVAGVVSRQEVPIELISPDLVPGVREAGAGRALAGDFLFRFGGLLDPGLRQSDFDLGYASVLSWLDERPLERYGLPAGAADKAARAASEAYRPGDGWRRAGGSGLRSLPWRGRFAVARLLGRMGYVAARDALAPR
jgi:predicted acylesterase/phospholipase RssA